MYNSLQTFRANIAGIQDLVTLHEYLTNHLKTPMNYDDILRFQIVYAVSAFDKLIHDLVRIGMLQIFTGLRIPTAKYLAERISLSAYAALSSATFPPKEFYFEQEVITKLRLLTFQAPDNISDGLSYIWEEKHKWQRIATAMSMSENDTKTKLRLIVDRRNKIVHEADIDLTTGGKFQIEKGDCNSTLQFVGRLGGEIAQLIK